MKEAFECYLFLYFNLNFSVRWEGRVSYIHRTWDEFVQYREIILDRYPNLSLDLPQLPRLSTSVSSSSHREEIAESRKNAITDLLSHVSGKNDIRDHSATITFLYEDERTIPSSRSGASTVDSMPIALGGKIKMDIKIDRTLEILIEHCQEQMKFQSLVV